MQVNQLVNWNSKTFGMVPVEYRGRAGTDTACIIYRPEVGPPSQLEVPIAELSEIEIKLPDNSKQEEMFRRIAESAPARWAKEAEEIKNARTRTTANGYRIVKHDDEYHVLTEDGESFYKNASLKRVKEVANSVEPAKI